MVNKTYVRNTIKNILNTPSDSFSSFFLTFLLSLIQAINYFPVKLSAAQRYIVRYVLFLHTYSVHPYLPSNPDNPQVGPA